MKSRIATEQEVAQLRATGQVKDTCLGSYPSGSVWGIEITTENDTVVIDGVKFKADIFWESSSYEVACSVGGHDYIRLTQIT